MRLGSLIKCSGEAAQTSYKLNVKGPGSKVKQLDSANPPGVKRFVLSPHNVQSGLSAEAPLFYDCKD